MLKVIGNAPALQHPFARQDVQQIARDLDAQWVLIGQLKTDGQKQRVIAHRSLLVTRMPCTVCMYSVPAPPID